MPFVVLAVVWSIAALGSAAIAAYLAHRWGREPFGWLVLGAVLGPLALLLLLALRRDDLHRRRPALVSGENGRPSRLPKVRVLMPVDGSPYGAKAADLIAAAFPVARLEAALLAVLPIELADGIEAPAGSPRRDALEREVSEHLRTAAERLEAAGVAYSTVTRFGDPAAEIIAAAAEGDYELIVMGRRGRSAVAKLLLGSVSEHVTKNAPCAVTVVG